MKKLIYLLAFAVVISMLVLIPADSNVVTDGLVSYWTFDKQDISNNTVKDVWGENSGTIVGNPTVVSG